MAKTSGTHTHKGHCQACGRIQAVDNVTKRIAKHGYRVAGFGFFMGVCPGGRGHGRLALEIERTMTDEIIAEMGRIAKEREEQAVKFETGVLTPESIRRDWKKDENTYKEEIADDRGRFEWRVKWEHASEYEQKAAIKSIALHLRHEAKMHTDHASYLTRLIEQVHGKQLVEVKKVERTPEQEEALARRRATMARRYPNGVRR